MSGTLEYLGAGRVLTAPRKRAVSDRGAWLLGHVGLLALAVLSTWFALAAANNDWAIDTAAAPEPHWLRGLLPGVVPGLEDPSFSGLLLGMLVAYLAVIAGGHTISDRAGLWVALGLVALFGVTPVLLSADLFGYLAYARLEVIHHLNPYAHAPSAVPMDPVMPYVCTGFTLERRTARCSRSHRFPRRQSRYRPASGC